MDYQSAYFHWTKVLARAIHQTILDATEHLFVISYTTPMDTAPAVETALKYIDDLTFDGVSRMHPIYIRLRHAVISGMYTKISEIPDDGRCKRRITELTLRGKEAPQTLSGAAALAIASSVTAKRFPLESTATDRVHSVENVLDDLLLLRESFSDLLRTNYGQSMAALVGELYRARRGFIRLGKSKAIDDSCRGFFDRITNQPLTQLDINELTAPLKSAFKDLMDFSDSYVLTTTSGAAEKTYVTRKLDDDTYVLIEAQQKLVQRPTLWFEFEVIFASFVRALEAYKRFLGVLFAPDQARPTFSVRNDHELRTLRDDNDTAYRNSFTVLSDNLQGVWFEMAQFFVRNFSRSIRDDIDELQTRVEMQLFVQ